MLLGLIAGCAGSPLDLAGIAISPPEPWHGGVDHLDGTRYTVGRLVRADGSSLVAYRTLWLPEDRPKCSRRPWEIVSKVSRN